MMFCYYKLCSSEQMLINFRLILMMFLYVVTKPDCRIHNAVIEVNFQVAKMIRLISLTTNREICLLFKGPRKKQFHKAGGQITIK